MGVGRRGGGDWRGPDWADTACVFRAAPRDQRNLSGAAGIADDGAQGGALRRERVQVRAGGSAVAEAGRVDRSPDGDSGGGRETAEAGTAVGGGAVPRVTGRWAAARAAPRSSAGA